MAAHTGHSTRSRRFIKIYLGTWGLLAVMALGYLAMLAFPRQSDAPPQAAVETAGGAMADAGSGDPGAGDPKSEPGPEAQSASQTASRLPAEADGRSDIRKDGAPPPDAMGERVARGDTAGETAQARVAALDERVPGTVGPVARPSEVPGITIADGGAGMNGAGTPALRAEAPSGPAPGAAADTPGEAPASPDSAATPAPAPFVPIETGSIAPPAPPVAPEPGIMEPMKPRIVKVAPVRVAPADVAPTERARETVSVTPQPGPKVEPAPEAKDGAEVDAADIPPDSDRKAAAETAAAPAKVASEPKSESESKSENRIASLAPEAAKEEIVFGTPVVRRGSHEFAVQLGASPSVEALRRSWDKMAEQHAAALGGLQPRVIEPGPDSGVYRLLAGPVPTKAQAERICAELGVGPSGCFATNYAGAPL